MGVGRWGGARGWLLLAAFQTGLGELHQGRWRGAAGHGLVVGPGLIGLSQSIEMDVAGEQLQSPQDGLGFWWGVRPIEFRQQRLSPFECVAELPFSVGPFDGSVATFAGAAHGRALLSPRF